MLSARAILHIYKNTPRGDYTVDIDANSLREILCYAMTYAHSREKNDGFTIKVQSLQDIPDELEKAIDKEREARWLDIKNAMKECEQDA